MDVKGGFMSCKYLKKKLKNSKSSLITPTIVKPLKTVKIVTSSPIKFSITDAVTNTLSQFAESKVECFNTLCDELLNRGWLEEQLDKVMNILESLKELLTTPENLLEELKAIISRILDSISDSISRVMDALNNQMDAMQFASYELFNAKKTLKITEPKLSELGDANPTDNQDANYTLDEDYPNSYGFIDDAKNWKKINKTSGLTENMYYSMSQDRKSVV